MKFEPLEGNIRQDSHQRPAAKAVPQAAPGSSNADQLQSTLLRSGTELLQTLDQIPGLNPGVNPSYAKLASQLKQLRNFRFQVGFAGGMSSGKSSVINSILEYPLMPTCKLTTTCVGTHLFYGEIPRISVVDDNTRKKVLDVDCTNISPAHFEKLKEYACTTTRIKIIENLQHFTDHNLFEDKDSFTPEMLNMNRTDPNHVIILMMILLTVYVDQNSPMMTEKTKLVNKQREATLNFFGLQDQVVNYTIHLQWNGELLKSGMTIIDLPGLGAYAPDKEIGDGQILKGHDSIATDAIQHTDAMVFLVDPEVDGTGIPALQAMISSTALKQAVNQNDLIIPILNKVDSCSGASEVKQAVEKFVSILQNTGIHKQDEDIHRYSAWYGEYQYHNIPGDRTCFYFRNYQDLLENVLEEQEADLSPEELHRSIMEKSRKKLAVRYKKSGIDELKEFFRATYVGKSKNQRSYSAIFALRHLAMDLVPPMQEQIKNCTVARGVAVSAIKEISKGLTGSIDGPIAQALSRIDSMELDTFFINAQLQMIPTLYTAAFITGLEDYKKRNLEICNQFETVWLGLSTLARIDKPGSPNQLRYANLCEQSNIFGILINEPNQAFVQVITHVIRENQNMYRSALQVFDALKQEIPTALDRFVADYQTKLPENGSHILVLLTALRDTLVQYVSQQIDAVTDSMKINADDLNKAGNDTVQAMITLNTQTAQTYSQSVLSEVQAALSKGMFFTEREYIQVTGEGGVNAIFSNLSLSSADRDSIESDVRNIGISQISNNLDSWYQDTKSNIYQYFTSLRQHLFQMMDDTVKLLTGDAEQLVTRRDELQVRLQAVKEALDHLRDSVQPLYDASLQDVSAETLLKHRGNIFSGIT